METIYFYYLYVAIVAFFGYYTLSLQGATLYWGKKIVSESSGMNNGLQNALTPNSQNYRNIAAPILLISTAIVGYVYFNLLTGIIGITSTIILSVILSKLLPSSESEYYYNKMIKIMMKKKELARKENKPHVERAAQDVIELLELKKDIT